jgi:hypothetical protein
MAFKSRNITRNGEKVRVTSQGEYEALKQQGWTDATPVSAGDFDNETQGVSLPSGGLPNQVLGIVNGQPAWVYIKSYPGTSGTSPS